MKKLFGDGLVLALVIIFLGFILFRMTLHDCLKHPHIFAPQTNSVAETGK
jgi:hypothetical protein